MKRGGSSLSNEGSTRAWRKLRARVLAEEPVCRWCGNAPSDQVDHIVPRVAGGDDRRDNLAGSCRSCNLTRGARAARRAEPSADW